MNKAEWQAFSDFRDSYKKLCIELSSYSEILVPLQKAAAEGNTPDYPLQTAVVYNKAYDDFSESDEIKLIVVGDNPGKNEQLSANNRYLVGQSGKIAEGFFRKNQELGIDFRRNVLILNKTPIHTAKTTHLKFLQKNGNECVKKLLFESQVCVSELTAKIQQELNVELWLVGYAELKNNGVFIPYRNSFKNRYAGANEKFWEKVKVYQHFSMNRFLIDLRQFQSENIDFTLKQSLSHLGEKHRLEIFGQ